MLLRTLFCGLFLISAVQGEDQEFRGWKAGDWVLAASVDQTCLSLRYADGVRVIKEAEYNKPYETKLWCRINAVSKNILLVTVYYSSTRTLKQYEKKETENINKVTVAVKQNIEADRYLTLIEWPRGTNPPRPWWPW